MSSHRHLFYEPGMDSAAESVTLTGAEHHHLARSLRCAPGDRIFVTNGRGLTLECRVRSVGRTSTVSRVSAVVDDRAPRNELTLALATIRKDRFARAFEQCTELGITRCVPFVAANAAVPTYGEGFLERLRKVGVAAIKQSFRSVLPVVDEPLAFDGLVALARRTPRVVVGRQDAPRPAPADGQDTLVVVGPEAGLSDAEYDALAGAGARFASVSPHRLRSGTAAVALVAALWRGD